MASGKSIEAGSAFVRLTTSNSAFEKGLKSAQARLNAFAQGAEALGSRLAAVGAVAGAGIATALKSFASQGDTFSKMSDRTGIAVEALSLLDYAVSQSGGTLEDFEKGVRKMQQTLADAGKGSSAAVNALADIGVTLESISGLTPDAQFAAIADKLSQIEDPGARAAAAMDVFGKSGAALLPLMVSGAKGISLLTEQGKRFGREISGQVAADATAFGDAVDDAVGQAKRLVFEIGAALAPAAKAAAEEVRAVVQRTTEWASANKGTIIELATVALKTLAVGLALLALGKAAAAIAAALNLVSVAAKAAGVAMAFLAAHPVAAVFIAAAAAVATLTATIRTASDEAYRYAAAMATAREKADALRQLDQLRIQRLQQLADKTKLSAKETEEAANLVKSLEGTYGNFGVTIDGVTGKINGMADAQGHLNDAMRRSAVMDLSREYESLTKQIKAKQTLLNNARAGAKSVPVLGLASASAAESGQDELNELLKKRAAVQIRLEAAKGGNLEALVGGPKAEAEKLAGSVAKGHADAEESARAIVDARQAAIDAEKQLASLTEAAASKRRSSLENELRDIEALRIEQQRLIDVLIEGERVRAGGARPERLQELESTRTSVNANAIANATAASTRAEEASLETARRIAQDKADFEKGLDEDIARARIDLMKEGVAKNLAMLELEKQSALEAAKLAGVSEARIDELFKLRAGAVEAANTASGSVSGTFNARAVGGLELSPLLKIAAQQLAETKRGNEIMADIASNDGLTFA